MIPLVIRKPHCRPLVQVAKYTYGGKKMINKVIKRVLEVLANTKDREYQKQFQTKPTAFSRPRRQKMKFYEMILYYLVNTGQSLSIDLLKFFNNLPEMRETISKQAFSKQRLNIDCKIFEDLNNKYIKLVYADRMLLFHGRLLIAVDGSTAEIPNTQELIKHFGSAKASDTSAQNARVGLNGFYDPLNHILLKLVVDEYQKNEVKVFRENVGEIIQRYGDKPICFIFDRGYISLALLLELDQMGVEYLFRLPSYCYKEEVQSASTKDEEIEINITKYRLKNVDSEEQEQYLAQKTKRVRLVQVELDTGEIEYLITNIASSEISYNEMKAFYYKRWEIERVFNLLKNRLHIEDIGARTPEGVKQEIQATVFLGNIIEDIIVDVNEKLPQSEKNKHHYYVNVNLLCGMVKNYFLLIYYLEALSDEIREWYYKMLIGFIQQTVIAKNIGKNNPRIKRVSRNKYKTNIRNSY